MPTPGIQSIIFKKDKYSEAQAKQWLKKRGYTTNFKGKGTDEKPLTYRFRQQQPLTKKEKAKGYYYITTKHPSKKGIAFVIIVGPPAKETM